MSGLPQVWTGNTASKPFQGQPEWCSMHLYLDVSTRPPLRPLFGQAAERLVRGYRVMGPRYDYRLVWMVVFGLDRGDQTLARELIRLQAEWHAAHPELAELERPRHPWWGLYLVGADLRPHECVVRIPVGSSDRDVELFHLAGDDIRESPEFRALAEGRINPALPQPEELVLQAGHVARVVEPDGLEWALAEQRRQAPA